MEQILSTLQNRGLYANKEKCYFGMQTIMYLGYVIDSEGLYVDPKEI